ncbi:motility associated factor glycosyltransferase family protein [Clostridium botulinum]|uniref:motility associated factor glycosyltransferase family protein n=1 Tax=Clostridium botulinum TaxID=1491 RepID=UPI0013CBCA27|nr:6-hydroxymethylpterin diphosphokinase MptE-like protein [Clostridium botulinum]MBY6836418.1 motility associated factor glycosyltransferase family protein [Clostridium botulinum]NFG64262.1 motility associated factor glycosyltransferase family protein [Clostridium botulinum]NFN18135.1 motility associated factor glycosyltransferase family protein [Clostridium botulinum]NFN47812.1 motility associated factor glycosyltransferase family protein [Clostridium botulinum]NFQ23034.1 motility associated
MNKSNEEILNYLKQITLEDEERYNIEISKDNNKIMKIKKDNKVLYLGSKYNVNRDIENFKLSINEIRAESIIIVWGFGTGEHILELLKEVSISNKILIIEPDEKVLVENILSNAVEKIFNDDRIFILNYKKENIKNFLSENIRDTEVNSTKIVEYANYNKIYNEEYSEFLEAILEFTNNTAIAISTSLGFSKQFFKCFTRNIKQIIKSTVINELNHKFKNMSAIVVSAGPSLEKNIHLLKDVQDKFIIITGGRTLKTLLDEGIRPDFVCSIDPGEGSYRVIEKALDSEVPLVFSEVSNYKMVEEYKGNKIFFEDMDFHDITYDLIRKKADGLWQGGSVAHICISLAAYLGCNNIIFVGQDLAYTNNKYHADSASLNNNSIEKDNKYIYVDDIYGEEVPTTIQLDFYRKNIEKMILEYSEVTFINSTEGGANIKGTLVKLLKDSIKEYAHNEFIDKNIDDILNKKILVDKELVHKNVIKLLKSIKITEQVCKEGIVYASRMYKYYDKNIPSDISYILNQLDRIDSKLNKELEKSQSLKKLYAPLVAKIMISDTFKEKPGESEKDTGKRLALKSETIYKGLLDIMKEAKTEFEEVEKELI